MSGARVQTPVTAVDLTDHTANRAQVTLLTEERRQRESWRQILWLVWVQDREDPKSALAASSESPRKDTPHPLMNQERGGHEGGNSKPGLGV